MLPLRYRSYVVGVIALVTFVVNAAISACIVTRQAPSQQSLGEQSPSVRAWEERERLYGIPEVQAHVPQEWLAPGSFFREERRRNGLRNLETMPHLGAIVAARISKPANGGDTVISLIDVDGRVVSLSTEKGEPDQGWMEVNGVRQPPVENLRVREVYHNEGMRAPR